LAPIAVLRLDNDWYKSTRFCLETLYARVVEGGLVIIDDYHTFIGCKTAVDEFRQKHGIASPMITTESCSEAYWRKAN
jgi:O-methyltransferase